MRHRRSPECQRRLFDQVKGLCVYCNVRPADHLDHIVPFSRGGVGALANRAPACRPCGDSKGNLTVVEWMEVRAAEAAASGALTLV